MAGTLFALAIGVAGQTPPKELKLSTAAGPATPLGRASERWAEIAARSQSPTTLKVYAGASLAQRDPLRELQSVIDGNADAAVGSALAWSTQVPSLMVYALPWIAPDRVALNALVADADVRASIEAALDERGVVLLAMAPLGYRDIATRTSPIRVCRDLAGLKLRVLAHPMLVELYASLGASPLTMSFADAQAAFADNRLDGEEALPAALASARVAGARYVAVPGAIGDAMLFAVRRDAWTTLDEAAQRSLRRAAEQAAGEIGGAEADEAALVDLRRQGATVTRFGSIEMAQCKSAAQPVFDKWANPVGAALVARARAIAARGHTHR